MKARRVIRHAEPDTTPFRFDSVLSLLDPGLLTGRISEEEAVAVLGAKAANLARAAGARFAVLSGVDDFGLFRGRWSSFRPSGHDALSRRRPAVAGATCL